MGYTNVLDFGGIVEWFIGSSGVIPRRSASVLSSEARGVQGSYVKQAKPALRELCPAVLPNIFVNAQQELPTLQDVVRVCGGVILTITERNSHKYEHIIRTNV